MLLIDVRLAKSPIEGIGVFAKSFVPKGTMVWKLDLRFDRLLELAVCEAETGAVGSYLERYCYPRRADPRYVVFEADDARYMNHADEPNTDFSGGDEAFAVKDIQPGDEVTCNYNAFFEDGFEFLGDR